MQVLPDNISPLKEKKKKTNHKKNKVVFTSAGMRADKQETV